MSVTDSNTPPAPVPFTILGGYLGAGKTTLLNRLLRDNDGRRIALLINDFGAINIDAELIESRSDQQINLTNGCVCCGLSDGFDEAIDQLLRAPTPPDCIVVEASGVADVHSLAQYGKAPGLELDAVIVVADAETVQQKARDKYVANTVTRQLQAASLLILNKTDLVDAKRLAQVSEWLKTLSSAPIIATRYCELPNAVLFGNIAGSLANPVKGPAAPPTHGEEHTHHETYATWNFSCATPLPQSRVDDFLEALPEFVLRGKGFFRIGNASTGATTHAWHRVGSREELAPVKAERTTQIVAIGLAQNFSCKQLDALASRCFNAPSRPI